MVEMAKLNVLLVDDSFFFRSVLKQVLEGNPFVDVVGEAANGKIALSKIKSLKPHFLTLDLEMPEMNGLELLQAIRDKGLDVGSIIVSVHSSEGAEITIKALQLGAFDFVLKPSGANLEENKKSLETILFPIIKALVRRYEVRRILRTAFPDKLAKGEENVIPDIGKIEVPKRPIKPVSRKKSRVVAVGISTGGPVALQYVLQKLPPDLGVPVLVVQHMPKLFTKELAKFLDSKTAMEVKEARDGDLLMPNTVYIAPGGLQMKVGKGLIKNQYIIRITDDPPENGCKPSADYLFRSVARLYGDRSTCVIMTGMGSDGFEGLKLMKAEGATIIAQDEKSSVVFGMPKKPIEQGLVDMVMPLNNIAGAILRTVKDD